MVPTMETISPKPALPESVVEQQRRVRRQSQSRAVRDGRPRNGRTPRIGRKSSDSSHASACSVSSFRSRVDAQGFAAAKCVKELRAFADVEPRARREVVACMSLGGPRLPDGHDARRDCSSVERLEQDAVDGAEHGGRRRRFPALSSVRQRRITRIATEASRGETRVASEVFGDRDAVFVAQPFAHVVDAAEVGERLTPGFARRDRRAPCGRRYRDRGDRGSRRRVALKWLRVKSERARERRRLNMSRVS